MMVLSAGSWVCALPKAKPKHAGEIEPIQTDDEIRFFNESGSGFARAQARCGQVQRMSRRESRRIVAAGQYGGANRLGKTHAAIPVGLLARDPAHEDQRKLCFLDRFQRLLHGCVRHRRRWRRRETRGIRNGELLRERRLLKTGVEANIDRAVRRSCA